MVARMPVSGKTGEFMSYTKDVFKRLEALSLELPESPPPAGEYAAYRLYAGLGFLAA